MREYLELKTKVADNELHTAKLLREKEQLQERVTSLEEQCLMEKQITEGYSIVINVCSVHFILDLEKLKAKVADNEVYITEILEEKTQVEDKKHIITG